MMPQLIYGTCMLLSLAIAAMLWRQQLRQPVRLIFWTSLCFSGLALSNFVLVLDKVVYPDLDMALLRHAIALGSICLLLFGLLWEER